MEYEPKRRTFLKALGLGVMGAAGLAKESYDSLNDEALEAAASKAGAQALVAFRQGVDAERWVGHAMGLSSPDLEYYHELYNKAVEGVISGLDPFDKDFWTKIENNNPKSFKDDIENHGAI